jgi:hypothetical protein
MMSAVTEERRAEQAAARRRLRKIAAERRKAAKVEDQAIAHAIRVGVKQVEVMQDVERSREHVRLAARREGVESNRPPTAGRKPSPTE